MGNGVSLESNPPSVGRKRTGQGKVRTGVGRNEEKEVKRERSLGGKDKRVRKNGG